MLQQMRSSTGSWIAKGILGLLVLSFLGWGIADYARVGGGSNVVAKVGEREIGYSEFARAYQVFLQRKGLSQIESDVARQLNLAPSVLQSLTSRALYDAEAGSRNLTASDAMVKLEIESNPDFRGPTGQFDRLRFEQSLFTSGLTEAALVEGLRRDIGRSQLIDATTSGSGAPSALIDRLFTYFGERRSAEFMTLPIASVTAPTETDDTTLKAFFDDRQEDFRRPELRSLTYVLIAPEELAKSIEISSEDLAAAFEARQGEFARPERRDLAQILFQNESDAKQAALDLKGITIDQIPGKMETLGLKLIDLGEFTRESVPNEGLAEAVFNLDAPGATDAFEGAFGWSVAVVKSITQGVEPDIEAARETLTADLALDRAYAEVFERGKLLEDGFAQGQSLEEIAPALSLPVVTIDGVDANGRNPDGTTRGDLPAGLTFLRTAFALNQGDVSFLETTETNAMFMVRVDAITPAAIPEFAAVRDQVLSVWVEEQRYDAAETRAQTLTQRLNEAGDLNLLATMMGAEPGTVSGLTRTGQGENGASLPEALAQELFAKTVGQAAYAADGDNIIIARVTGKVDAPDAVDAVFRENIAQAVASGMAQDIVAQLGTALQNRYKTETFPGVYELVYQ